MKWTFIEETLAKKYTQIDTSKYIWNKLINTACEYGPGWHDLIIELFMKIEEIYSKNNIDTSNLEVYRIKEKYAGLRVDVSSSINEVYDLIIEYENRSESICEECGKGGSLHQDKGGWLFTVCNECALEKGFKKVDDDKEFEGNITLKIHILKDKIQLAIEDAILEIDRHPFFTQVNDIEYKGDGNIHFITNNDIELFYIPYLIQGEPPLLIKGHYESLGKQYTDEELLDLIPKIGSLEWSIEEQE